MRRSVTGATLAITWTTSLPATPWSALIELSRDGGSTYQNVGFGPNNGTFSWVVTGPATSTAQVRVSLGTPAVVVATSATFAIAAASVTVTSPAAGATVYTGTSVPITWSTNLPATSFVFVQLSRDGGNTWSELGMSATNTGSITWNNVQGPATSAARVKVTLRSGSTVGTSGTFAIAVPSLTVTSPAAGATLYAGDVAGDHLVEQLARDVPGHRRAESRRRQQLRGSGDERPQHGQLRLDRHGSGHERRARSCDGQRSRVAQSRRAARSRSRCLR